MATSQLSGVIQHLGRTAHLRDGAGLTDGQLLADYISRRDEAALAAVVGRHGPMVWGVCCRVLRNYHDAEDDRLVIEKSSLTLTVVGRAAFTEPETINAVADFSLDTKQTPKVLVLRWKKSLSGKEDVTQKAIYAVEGDTLKLCLYLFDETEKNPPTDFSANAGSKRALLIFKREPASDKKDEKPKQSEEKKGDKP